MIRRLLAKLRRWRAIRSTRVIELEDGNRAYVRIVPLTLTNSESLKRMLDDPKFIAAVKAAAKKFPPPEPPTIH